MRKQLTSILAAAMLTAAGSNSAHAEPRKFVSADGEKSFWGELTNYDPKKDKVSARSAKGRTMVFSADLLSEEDRAWVKEQYEIIKVGRNVRINARARHGDRKITKGDSKKSIDTSKFFDIEISNASSEEVSDLTIEYEIHVTQGGKRGVVKGGPMPISTLHSGVPFKFQSESVNLSQQIPLSVSVGAAGCST